MWIHGLYLTKINLSPDIKHNKSIAALKCFGTLRKINGTEMVALQDTDD